MTTTLKPFVLGATVFAMLCMADVSRAPFGINIISNAEAGLIVAPVRRTAVVTSVAVASSTANANAAAQANAAAAQANAAAAAAKSAAPPPVGTIVTTLPPGCAQDKLNGVDYMRCGSAYYKPSMVGTNLVFVVAQP